LTKAENRAVAAAAQRYGDFLQRPVVLAQRKTTSLNSISSRPAAE
jgi:hypothetical protein